MIRWLITLLGVSDPNHVSKSWRSEQQRTPIGSVAETVSVASGEGSSVGAESFAPNINRDPVRREPIVICERCQMRIPERLATFGISVRGGSAARCAACAPVAGPDGEAKRAEVIAMRKARANMAGNGRDADTEKASSSAAPQKEQ